MRKEQHLEPQAHKPVQLLAEQLTACLGGINEWNVGTWFERKSDQSSNV
jgi:hypothetical protein